MKEGSCHLWKLPMSARRMGSFGGLLKAVYGIEDRLYVMLIMSRFVFSQVAFLALGR